MKKLTFRRIKGQEFRDGKHVKYVDDDYMIWYDVIIGLLVIDLTGIAMGLLFGFLIWGKY